jgi:leucyl aminopeptidase (aminopeptidase T)
MPALPDRTVSRVLDTCLGVRTDETVALLVDDGTDPTVITGLSAGLDQRGCRVQVVGVPRYDLPGSELTATAAQVLLDTDAAIELTSVFVGSNQARRSATDAGRRYLAMPGVTVDTFRLGGPYDVDFDALAATVNAVAALWQTADTYRITTPAGTDLSGSIRGRKGRPLTGIARDPGAYMAPPDIESGTAPVEASSSGVVVIDGDYLFMGPGPSAAASVLHLRDGALVHTEGDEAVRLTEMISRCADPRMTNLAEVAIGLNPQGSVCGVAMETESSLGSAHIAFGNSIAYGGTVNAIAHLDCVMQSATVYFDDVPHVVEGVIIP